MLTLGFLWSRLETGRRELTKPNQTTYRKKDMIVRNFTPHTINMIELEFSIPSHGVARVQQENKFAFMWGEIPVMRTSFGEVTGLPEQENGVMLIVSAMVRAALPDRKDLVSPGDLVRDDQGRVIGCKSLIF